MTIDVFLSNGMTALMGGVLQEGVCSSGGVVGGSVCVCWSLVCFVGVWMSVVSIGSVCVACSVEVVVVSSWIVGSCV